MFHLYRPRGKDRRQNLDRRQGVERRSGIDRRQRNELPPGRKDRRNYERRSGIDRRQTDDRRQGFDRRLSTEFGKLVSGDFGWANLRLLLTLIVFFVMIVMGGALFEDVDTTATVAGWRINNPNLETFPDFLLESMAFFLTLKTLRYAIAPFAALVIVWLIAAHNLQDIYNLDGIRKNASYLFSSLFGLGYPILRIKGGEKILVEDEMNPLDIFGGPGYLVVEPGYAVLVEKAGSNLPVIHEGRYPVLRFERIREIVSLSDQAGSIENMVATTKDGIMIKVLDIRFRYRLRLRPPAEQQGYRSMSDPYPFSEKALRDLAFNRNVDKEGLVSWQSTIQQNVKTTITRYINRHGIDDLTAPGPGGKDPRREIKDEFRSGPVISTFNNVGTELVWIDIGRFEIPESKIDLERIHSWQAKWMGSASITRATGEAKRLAYQELGRAEAQADLLTNIVEGLDEIGLTGDHRQNLRNLILLRTAQILDVMSEKNQTGADQDLYNAQPEDKNGSEVR
jgi:hypothetical protein